MKRKVLMSAGLAVTVVLGAVAINWAKVPPPPVNQTLGIYDTQFGQLSRPDCLTAAPCHVSDEILVPRHHNLIDTKGKQCLDCHTLVKNPTTGIFEFADFRNCLNCHSSSPHHITTAAENRDCKSCHGSVIDNPVGYGTPPDTHYIPTYAKSSVTPNTKWKNNNASDPKNYGGCAVCHQQDLTATPRMILGNADTHHGTGLGWPTSQTGLPKAVGNCNWCHGPTGPTTFLDIRICEQCHGINSLHSIQVDTPNAANIGSVVPGKEDAGYGHIGANSDCTGCHGPNSRALSSAAPTTVPAISSISAQVLNTNVAGTLTIQGQSLVSADTAGNVSKPVVAVTNGTISLTIDPVSVTDTEVKVAVPALGTGNYELRLVKGSMTSNPVKIVVVPQAFIKSAVVSGSTLTITGVGLGSAPPVDYVSGIGVYVGPNQVPAKLISWSDTKAVVACSVKPGDPVLVKTLNNSLVGVVTGTLRKL